MNTRNRLINFRVTDEEFRRLKTASTLQNARCMSDFARSVMLRTTGLPSAAPESKEYLDDKLLGFDRRLAVLETKLARLVDALVNSETVSIKPEN